MWSSSTSRQCLIVLRQSLAEVFGIKFSNSKLTDQSRYSVLTMTEKSEIIGVISDTHGLLRREAVEALRGSDRILHSGDVGAPEILEALALNRAGDRGSWQCRHRALGADSAG